jgi:4'-phosphopantetheinyl transferase EntD
MQTQRLSFSLPVIAAAVDFDPATFQPEDLLWLPITRLSGCARKRQTEHLAGRIAGLRAAEVGEKEPAIGDQRQPCGPRRGTAASATANAARWRLSPPGRSALILSASCLPPGGRAGKQHRQ